MIITDKNILTKPCEDVHLSEAVELIKILEQELNHSAMMGRPGIGLAAPQCAIHKKAAIVRIPTNGPYELNVNLINARIEKSYSSFIFKGEGCLSFGNQVYDTQRYQEIYVVDNLVKPHSFIASGLMAVAIQHELDHLDGITFHQRAVISNVASNLKVRPNEKCPCQSGKKFKYCCRKEK